MEHEKWAFWSRKSWVPDEADPTSMSSPSSSIEEPELSERWEDGGGSISVLHRDSEPELISSSVVDHFNTILEFGEN
jgi:hypothetical protein